MSAMRVCKMILAWSSLAMAGRVVALAGTAQTPDAVSAFYVGNWLMDNAMPPWHGSLGQSVGKEWRVGVKSSRQLTLYMNLYAFRQSWSYRETNIWTADGPRKLQEAFAGGRWDALVVQPYGWMGLRRELSQMGHWADERLARALETEDFGDVASIAALFELFLRHHPGGELVVFEGVPELDRKRKADGSGSMRLTEAGPKPAPDREGFDYVHHWEQVRYDPGQGEAGRTQHTRDASRQLLEALRARFPDAWREGKVRCIPLGEVYNALDKRMRTGRLEGWRNVTAFYADTLHQRSGLPRYVMAATMYAVLFRDKPHGLDGSIYNDPGAYGGPGGRLEGFYIHGPHLGEHLPFSPEMVRTVNDVIWEVVSEHPHTGLHQGSPGAGGTESTEEKKR